MIHKLLAGKGKMKRGLSLLLCLALLGSSVISSNVTAEAESEVTVEAIETSETEEETISEAVVANEESTSQEAVSDTTETTEETGTDVTETPVEDMTEEVADEVAETTEDGSTETTTEQAVEETTSAGESVEAVSATDTESTLAVATVAEETVYTGTVTVNNSTLVTVEASAKAGTFPEDTTMSVTLLDAGNEDVENALDESGVEYDGYVSLDISFFDANGMEVEPEDGSVSVKISMDASLLGDDVDEESLTVQHLAENEAGEIEVQAVADVAEETDGSVEVTEDGSVSAEFTVGSFSYFTITYSYGNGQNRTSVNLTIYLVDEDGNQILGSSSLGSSSGSEDWQSVQTAAINAIISAAASGYLYEGAYLGGNDGSSLGETPVTYIKVKTTTEETNDGHGHTQTTITDAKWVYSSETSTPEDTVEGTEIGDYSIYLVFSKEDTSSGSQTEPGEIAPGYRKYVTKGSDDGTYNLTLSVTGGIEETENPVMLDIIYVLDVSGSMAYSMSENSGSSNARLKAADSAITTLTNSLAGNSNLDVRYALVTFSGSGGNYDDRIAYNDATTVVDWTNSASTLIRNLPSSADGGTNYEAGLYELYEEDGSVLNNTRTGAITVLVFISDGNTGYYYTTTGSTEGSGSTYNTTSMDHAVARLKEIYEDYSVDYFISVGVGPSSNYDKLQRLGYLRDTDAGYDESLNETYASTIKNTYGVDVSFYEGSSEDKLAEAFENIASTVTTFAFSKVSIEDTLSENVDIVSGSSLSILVTDENGQTVASGTGTATFTQNGSSITITAAYDSTAKEITLSFNPDTYELEDGWTYSVTAVIQATDTAYENYLKANGYPNEGEDNTDAPEVTENFISDGQKGVYTNDNAILKYTYNGTEHDVKYPMPVIPLEFGSLKITKTVKGLDTDALNALNTTLTFTYTSTDGVSSGTLKLSDFADGVYDETSGTYTYTYTVENLIPGKTYTVSESGYELNSDYGYVLDDSSSNTESKRVTIVKKTVSEALFDNVYLPASQTITVSKTVTGNMGETSKNFGFTLTLKKDSDVYMTTLPSQKTSQGSDTAASNNLQYNESNKNYYFELKTGEEIVITVPYGYSYTVSEAAYAGYTTTVTVTGNGTKSESDRVVTGSTTENISLGYVNDKTASAPTGFTSDVAPYVAALAIALGGAVLMFVSRRRRV